jgi:coenzyme Q-binding protein COQ10
MPRVEHSVVIEAPIADVFAIITDYERYPEFLPDMKEVRVIDRHDGVALVRFEIELVMRLSYTLRLVEDAPTRIAWTLEEAKMMEENVGGWTLVEDGPNTRATYALDVKLRGLIPKSVSNRLMGTTLPQTLDRFKRRAEAKV